MVDNHNGEEVELPAPFTLLTVCTGNICRSPLAEELFRMGLSRVQNLQVESAGLHALSGQPMDEIAAQQLVKFGGKPEGLIGQQFTESHAKSADLILTMTLDQRNELVRKYPRATRRTFSLGELALILGQLQNPMTLVDIVKYAGPNRSKSGVTLAHDIVDPYRQSIQVHQDVAHSIAVLVDSISSNVL